jgi:hypothetical protein
MGHVYIFGQEKWFDLKTEEETSRGTVHVP